MGKEIIYTPELSGSGQFGRCGKCGLMPTNDGHDGCLGELDSSVVMNACCGHGKDEIAYIQFWDKSCVRGSDAVKLFKELKA